MNWLRFLKRAQADAEQQQELESYIEITAEEYVAQGMGAHEARRAARRKLGNLTRIREEVYEMNTATFVESTLQQLRHSVRMLRLNPAFSLTAVLTLALGIGATTAIFSVVNGVVIKPLPYPDSDAVVTVTHSAVFGNVRGRDFPFSPQMLAVYSANNQTFQEVGLWTLRQAAVTGLAIPESVVALQVTQGTLPALGVQPAMGRWFSRADDQPGAPETIILTNAYWERRFGGDPGVIGRVITLDSRPRQVIGIMPATFTLASVPIDLLLPLRINLAQPPSDWNYRALARLKKGVTVAQANADVARMLPVYLERYAGHRMDALHLQPAVRPFKEDVVGNVGQVLWVLLGGISILLLIACANVANLLLVRAEGRGQELAVRTALGAGWGHIARALMVESLTLSLLGGLMGLGLAYGGLRILLAYGPATLPRLKEITIDPNVLAFALATSVVSGLLFGLIPIAKLAGPKSGWSLLQFVRGGGRWASAGNSQHRSQNVLVVVQVALALVLLISSGLLIRTLQNLRNVDPGFAHPEAIQTARIYMPPAMIAEPDRMVRTQAQILERLEAIPGVTSAAYVDSLPMDGGGGISVIVAAEDKTYPAGELPPTRAMKMISPGLFRTLETRLIAGRDVDWMDLYNQRNVALASESFARETWNTVAGAIGKRIKLGTTGSWQEVIGVVADIHDAGANQPAPPIVYWPARQHQMIGNVAPVSVAFTLRSNRTGTEGFLSDIRHAVAAVDPNLPLTSVNTMAAVYEISMARTSFSLVLLGIAGAMALLLGIVGVYGALAYAVMQREREVGIRLALGAQPRRVKQMFVYRGMILSGAGIAFGAAAATGLTRLMSSLLFGVKPVDTATFASAAGMLALAALAASYIPARRAAAVDPVETLRGQ
ncbi:MAG TPA: ABC transporter permease [Bryobacteraceae bacterium]|nr:ABC transporter permease [Bryobacteraceae bacterium]